MSNVLGSINFGSAKNLSEISDLGSSSFAPLKSDVYPAHIDNAYIKQTDSGSLMFYLKATVAGGKEVSDSWCIYSGSTGPVDKSGNKLIGITTVDNLLALVAGTSLDEIKSKPNDVVLKKIEERKYVNGKWEPMTVNAYVVKPLVGKQVQLAILLRREYKRTLSNGEWITGNETSDKNKIVNFFETGTGFSAAEKISHDAYVAKAKAHTGDISELGPEPVPVKIGEWRKRWSGIVDDKTHTSTAGSSRNDNPLVGPGSSDIDLIAGL